MEKVLVTGGCGYIGSHTIVDLIGAGYHVISIDNFSNSAPVALDRIEAVTGTRVHNYNIDLCDQKAVDRVFEEHPDVFGVVHFAAFKAVGESVEKPFKYFRNNLLSVLNVAEACLHHEIRCMVYSSSCTVYGNPDTLPVTEQTPVKPAESPYGRTKQMGEQILEDGLKNTGVQVISLRYFNPGGAHPSGLLGEDPILMAPNLIPAITETGIGVRDELVVYGDDYDTRDGSCIRDYIHIMDLARAHTLALKKAMVGMSHNSPVAINLGIGEGVTVLEAVRAFERVSGRTLNYRIGARRPGDIAAIYADYAYAKEFLGWSPRYNVEDIMRTAWQWEINRHNLHGS